MTAEELVLLGRTAHLPLFGRLSGEDREICRCAMEDAGISHLCSRKVSSLSGGEKQRAFIAMILSQNAEILLFDEPSSYMDPDSRTAFYGLLLRLRDDFGKTVLTVLHDLPDALRYCDRTAVLDGGRIVFHGESGDSIDTLARVFSVTAHRFDENGRIYTVFD